MPHFRSRSAGLTSIGEIYDNFEREQEGLVNRFQREIDRLQSDRTTKPRTARPLSLPGYTDSSNVIGAYMRLQHENERLQHENACLYHRLQRLEKIDEAK